MAEVRCPMCGKSNPPQAELCQFCEARLKPLLAGSSGDEGQAPEDQELPGFSGADEPGSDDWGEEGGLPAWLQSLRQEDEALKAAAPSEDEPDAWISGEPASADAESQPAEPDIPDWLAGLRGEPETILEDAGEPEKQDEANAGLWAEESALGWLENAPAPDETKFPEADLPAAEQPAGDTEPPGWLRDLQAQQRAMEEPPEEPPAAPTAEQPAGEAESPDWLRDLQARQRPLGLEADVAPQAWEESQETPPVPPFVGSTGLDREQTGQPAESGAGSGPLDKLPEWLASFPNDETEHQTPEPPAAESPGGLAPAELPAWLEAMRPVESAAPPPPFLDEGDRQVENSGPLMGLSGVLPVEPSLPRSKKPVVYSGKLQVTEHQQSHADTFAELIKKEGEAHPIAARPPLSSLALWRWIIFIVLVLGIAWPVWTASQDTPLPAFTPETEAASTLINALAGGDPVLLAVDYQPGLSAEMDAASAAVLDHLMLKGVYLTLVSTLPSGPLQAERLLIQVNARGGHRYAGLNEYANLGYIPGGTTGLLGLVQSPRRTLPFALDGNRAWQETPLQGVNGLTDFALVMVLTESAETAQAWIEQVQPALGHTPLVMVISAQAEPVVRPYYEARPQQVKGIVAGLAGGASYEALQARPGPARKYWDSFSLGLLLAAGLIVIAGAASAASTRFSSRKPADGEKTA